MEALLGDRCRRAQPPPGDCYAVLIFLPRAGRGGRPCRLACQCVQPATQSMGMQCGRGRGRGAVSAGKYFDMLVVMCYVWLMHLNGRVLEMFLRSFVHKSVETGKQTNFATGAGLSVNKNPLFILSKGTVRRHHCSNKPKHPIVSNLL